MNAQQLPACHGLIAWLGNNYVYNYVVIRLRLGNWDKYLISDTCTPAPYGPAIIGSHTDGLLICDGSASSSYWDRHSARQTTTTTFFIRQIKESDEKIGRRTSQLPIMHVMRTTTTPGSVDQRSNVMVVPRDTRCHGVSSPKLILKNRDNTSKFKIVYSRLLLLQAFLAYYSCIQKPVSGLSLSNLGDLVVGPRSLEWAQTYCPESMQSQHLEEFERTHALFSALSSSSRSSSDTDAHCSTPFFIRRGDSVNPLMTFGTTELKEALQHDFLDAGEGSTDERRGWRMKPVARTNSEHTTTATTSGSPTTSNCAFLRSRVTFSDLEQAKGTVIFNSAGAYTSSTLAATCLAALDGMNTGMAATVGVCLNLYVTTKGDAKTSAPPHTDMQDVVVLQTQGRKHWKVYSPPDNRIKPSADPFARGKGEDDLPVETLEASGSKLLFEVTLNPGDVLFVPSRFPHTTDTLSCYKDEPEKEFGVDDWSIHLTVGLDSHVWSMNYMSMRRLGLMKFGLVDVLGRTGATVVDDSACVGFVNSLSRDLREQLFRSINGDFLQQGDVAAAVGVESKMAAELFLLNLRVNAEATLGHEENLTLTLEQCMEIVAKFSIVGKKIWKTHQEMYLAALDEEHTRRTVEVDWIPRQPMTKECVERLSIFRVPAFFEALDQCRDDLRAWALEGTSGYEERQHLILSGDQIEVHLLEQIERSWIPGKVVEVRSNGLYDIQLFDGKLKRGISRKDIKGPHGIGIFI